MNKKLYEHYFLLNLYFLAPDFGVNLIAFSIVKEMLHFLTGQHFLRSILTWKKIVIDSKSFSPEMQNLLPCINRRCRPEKVLTEYRKNMILTLLSNFNVTELKIII